MQAEIEHRHTGKSPQLRFRQFDRERLIKSNFVDTNVIAHRPGLPDAHWDSEFEGMEDRELAIRLTADKPALALPAVAVLYRTHAPNRMMRPGAYEARRADRERVRARVRLTGR